MTEARGTTRARLFLLSVWHTHPRQLLARLALLIKRRVLSRLASPDRARRTATASALKRRAVTPAPLFAPRRQFVVGEDPLEVTFLNRPRVMGPDIDWRPRELRTGTRLWLLNLHYMEFLEGVHDDTFERVVTDWIERVLPYVPGYWLDCWNSYALSIRVVVWMQQLAVRDLSVAVEDRLLRSLTAQLAFLESNLEKDIGGNHIIKNIKALLWAGSFFEGSTAERWRRKGEALLEQELSAQILSDGLHFELSPAYHNQVFADLLECLAVLPEGNSRKRLRHQLERMAAAVADFTHPDGRVSLFGDAGLHMAYAPAELLCAARGLGIECPQAGAVIAYSEAGYYGVRGPDALALFDCGRIAPDHLPAHGHGDALALEWSVGGLRCLIDPGVYEYNAGERRSLSRATRRHNTLTLNDQDQAEFYGAFRLGMRPDVELESVDRNGERLVVTGSHDGFRVAGARHRRRVDLSPDAIVVRDEVVGGDGADAVARFILHPDWAVNLNAEGALCSAGGVTVRLESDAPLELTRVPVYMDFGQEAMTRCIEVHYGPAPCVGEVALRRA